LATAQTTSQTPDLGLAGLITRGFESGNYVQLFFLFLLIGLAINLTPCIYPLIPITIAFFSNQSGPNIQSRLSMGGAYALGIAITYGILGGIAASLGGAIGMLFTKPWFLYGIAAFLFILALSMFDVYQIGLPPVLSRHLRGRSGITGAWIMGLLVGFAAVPCAGPLIVAVFVEIAKLQNFVWGVLAFTTIGLGLGIPYIFLAAFSSSVQSLPKAGPWMKIIKAVLGFVVIGVSLSYLLLALPQEFVKTYQFLIWAIFYILLAAYIALADKAPTTRGLMLLKGAIILFAGIYAGLGIQKYQTESLASKQAIGAPLRIEWIPFNAETFAAAKASGKPIFIEATANWCKVCQVIEEKVFSRPEVIKMLQNVVTLRVDWSTGVDDKYIAYTQEALGLPGVPYFFFFKPGGIKSSELSIEKVEIPGTVQELFEHLKKAGAKF
jgi:thiol:disulfide interchange protein DsbD